MEESGGKRESWGSRLRGSWLHLSVCAFLVAISFAQQPGKTTFDTKFDLTAGPAHALGRSFQLWDTGVNFGGLANQGYGYLFPQGAFFVLGDLIAIPDWIVQRTWSALVLLAAYEGARRLARALGVGTGVIPIAVGLTYALSPRIVGLSGSLTAEILPSALLPWVCLPLVLALTGRLSARRAAVLSALAVVCMGGVNASENLLALPLALFLVCSGLRSASGRQLARWWVACTTLASLWWMLPLLLLGRYSPPFLDYIETAATTTRTSGWNTSARGAEHWLGYIDVGPGQWWPVAHEMGSVPALVILGGVITALGLAGLARTAVPFRVPLVLSLVVGLVAATAGHGGPAGSPFAGGIRDLLDDALAPFRNVHKVDPLIRLPIAIGVGLACVAVNAYLKRGRRADSSGAQRWAAVAIVALVVGSAAPVFGNPLRHPGWDRVPTAWTQAADWLDKDGPGTTLVLPATGTGQQLWGWTIDEPIQPLARSGWATRSQIPLVPSNTIRFLDGIEDRLADGSGSPEFAATLAAAGITRVLVRNDLEVAYADTADPAKFATALEHSPGLSLVKSFGSIAGVPELQAYRVAGATGEPALLPTETLPVLTGAPEDVIGAREAGLLGDVNHAEVKRTAKGETPDVVTDGYRRVERQFGRFHDATSQVMTADELGRTGRKVVDFAGVPGVPRVYAEYTDVSGVTATSSAGNADAVGAIRPELGPASVLDGDPATYWRSAPFEPSRGQAVRITLARSQPIGRVTAVLGVDGASGARVTSVRIQAGAERRTVAVGPDGTVTVDFGDQVSTRHVGVTIMKTSSPRTDAPVAVRDIAIDGVNSTRSLVIPEVGAGAGTSFLFSTEPPTRACLTAPLATSCDQAAARPGVEERHLGRTFTVDQDGTWTLSGTAVALADPASARLLLPLGKAMAATSDSVLDDDPAVAPMFAVDGRPDTSWLAAPDDKAPAIDLQWSTPRTISRLQVVPSLISARSPYEVDIDAGGQHRTVQIGSGGLGFFDPITASSARITLRAHTGTSGTHLPIGVGELRFTGLGGLARPVATDVEFTSLCGLGPLVEVGGRRYRTTVTGTLDDVIKARPMTWTSCSGPVALDAGTQHLQVTATGAFSATTIVLKSQRPRTALSGTSSRSVLVAPKLASSMTIKVASGPESVLVFGQNENPGWKATLNGKALRAQVVDGWQQGFVVPSGNGGTVKVSFAPTFGYQLALGLGGLGILALLTLLLLDLRRPAPVVAAAVAQPPGGRAASEASDQSLRSMRGAPATDARPRQVPRTLALTAGLITLALLGGPVVAAAAVAGALLTPFISKQIPALAAVLALAAAVVAATSSSTASGDPGTAADLVMALACGVIAGTLARRSGDA